MNCNILCTVFNRFESIHSIFQNHLKIFTICETIVEWTQLNMIAFYEFQWENKVTKLKLLNKIWPMAKRLNIVTEIHLLSCGQSVSLHVFICCTNSLVVSCRMHIDRSSFIRLQLSVSINEWEKKKSTKMSKKCNQFYDCRSRVKLHKKRPILHTTF